MIRVCKHTDIGQADGIGHGSHGGFILRTEDAVGRRTRRGGQAGKVCFLVCEHSGGGGRLVCSSVVQAFGCTSGCTGRAKEELVAALIDVGGSVRRKIVAKR